MQVSKKPALVLLEEHVTSTSHHASRKIDELSAQVGSLGPSVALLQELVAGQQSQREQTAALAQQLQAQQAQGHQASALESRLAQSEARTEERRRELEERVEARVGEAQAQAQAQGSALMEALEAHAAAAAAASAHVLVRVEEAVAKVEEQVEERLLALHEELRAHSAKIHTQVEGGAFLVAEGAGRAETEAIAHRQQVEALTEELETRIEARLSEAKAEHAAQLIALHAALQPPPPAVPTPQLPEDVGPRFTWPKFKVERPPRASRPR